MAFIKLQLTKIFAKLGTITKISKNLQEEIITILKQKTAYFSLITITKYLLVRGFRVIVIETITN